MYKSQFNITLFSSKHSFGSGSEFITKKILRSGLFIDEDINKGEIEVYNHLFFLLHQIQLIQYEVGFGF